MNKKDLHHVKIIRNVQIPRERKNLKILQKEVTGKLVKNIQYETRITIMNIVKLLGHKAYNWNKESVCLWGRTTRGVTHPESRKK